MKNQINKERTHLFSPAANIAVRVDITGNPKSDEVITAIKKAVQSNEILNCGTKMIENGEAFYSRVSEPVYRIETFSGPWTDLIVQQEKIRFEIEKGEFVRFFLGSGGDDVLQLVIIAHHLAGDGLSITYLVRDILTALSGKDLTSKPLELFSVEDLPRDSRLSFLMRFMLQRINKRWQRTGTVFSFKDNERLFKNYWDKHQTTVYSYSITDDEYLRLINESKQKHVTVNSILTTALLRASGKMSDVGLAVNIRKPGYEGMGNYATGISIQFAYNESKDFWTNTRAVQKLIYAKLNNTRKKYFLLQFMGNLKPTLIDAVFFSAYDGYDNKTANTLKKMFGYGGNPKGISITNLTRIDIPDVYGKYAISDFMFVPPLVLNGKRVFGISTFNNRLNITLHVENDEEAASNEKLLSQAVNYLKG